MSSPQFGQMTFTGGTPPAGGRAAQLASRFQRANEAFAILLDGLTDEQWTTPAVNTPGRATDEDEDRPVGTIAHHLATVHSAFLARIKAAVEGTPPPIPTGTLAERNAAHAAQHQRPDRVKTAALLRSNGAAIVTYVSQLGEEQVNRLTEFGGRRLTTEQLIGEALVGHIHDHELSIRAAVGRPTRLVRRGEGRLFDWGSMKLVMPVGAADSEGRIALFVGTVDPGVGNTVMHRHREHEVFYVLEGSFAVGGVRDGRVFTLTAGPGDLVDVPSWEPHHWSASGDRPGKLLVLVMPGGIESMLGGILSLDATRPQPGPEAYAALWTTYGHERVEATE